MRNRCRDLIIREQAVFIRFEAKRSLRGSLAGFILRLLHRQDYLISKHLSTFSFRAGFL
jgi:hypothetical protein